MRGIFLALGLAGCSDGLSTMRHLASTYRSSNGLAFHEDAERASLGVDGGVWVGDARSGGETQWLPMLEFDGRVIGGDDEAVLLIDRGRVWRILVREPDLSGIVPYPALDVAGGALLGLGVVLVHTNLGGCDAWFSTLDIETTVPLPNSFCVGTPTVRATTAGEIALVGDGQRVLRVMPTGVEELSELAGADLLAIDEQEGLVIAGRCGTGLVRAVRLSDGEPVWSREHASPLLALDAITGGEGGTAIGLTVGITGDDTDFVVLDADTGAELLVEPLLSRATAVGGVANARRSAGVAIVEEPADRVHFYGLELSSRLIPVPSFAPTDDRPFTDAD